jgi:hypothetical protein
MTDPNAWYRDKVHTMDAWQFEVANEDTKLGYIDWAVAQYEQAGQEVPVKLAAEITSPAADGVLNGVAQVTDSEREEYEICDWQTEVIDGHTRLGFEAWVMHQVEANAPPPRARML